jgi:hypothetical protein
MEVLMASKEPERTKAIRVRVTPAEFEALQRRKDRAELAPWIRDYCLGAAEAPTTRETTAADPELLRQLAGIGNNLNQIARWLNQYGPGDRVELLTELAAIERQLAALREEAEA